MLSLEIMSLIKNIGFFPQSLWLDHYGILRMSNKIIVITKSALYVLLIYIITVTSYAKWRIYCTEVRVNANYRFAMFDITNVHLTMEFPYNYFLIKFYRLTWSTNSYNEYSVDVILFLS